MRFVIQPVGFHVSETEMETTVDTVVKAKTVTIIDASRVTVEITFGEADWEAFQRYIADPEAETLRQEARAKLMLATPGQPLPPQRGSKH